MKVSVVHETRYAYAVPVVLCHNEARLLVREVPGQLCHRSALRIDPLPMMRTLSHDGPLIVADTEAGILTPVCREAAVSAMETPTGNVPRIVLRRWRSFSIDPKAF